MYPKTSLLERKVWDYLNSQPKLLSVCVIKDTHPNSKTEIPLNKGLLTISSVGNPTIGLYITNQISAPLFRFTGYSPKRSVARGIQELVLDIWSNYQNLLLSTDSQKLQTVELEGVIEPTLEKSIELYYASALYQFHLTKY